MDGLAALEEGVAPSFLSGTWFPTGTWGADPSSKGRAFNPANPTIAIGPAFGTQLAKGGGVEAVAPKSADSFSYTPPAAQLPYGYSQGRPVFSPPPSPSGGGSSGPDWTPQPGMMYAAGQAIAPQDFISKYGMQTYLEVGGSRAAAPAADFSSGSSPAQAARSGVAVGGPGIPFQQQTTGPQVSTGAATLDMKQYFRQGRQEIRQARGLPAKSKSGNPSLKDYATEDIGVHLLLLVAALYWIAKVRVKKE